MLEIDRDTASRLGITPQLIDDTLYDAFGQRQVSTIFTQLNQYHVVLEVEPAVPAGSLEDLSSIYVRSSHGRRGPARARSPASRRTTRAPRRQPTRASSRRRRSRFNLAPGASLGAAVRAIQRATRRARHAARASRRAFRARRARSRRRCTNEPLLILAAVVTVYIVLGVLYESFIHPITILSTLPSAAVGALLALCSSAGPTSSVVGLIGIILLIGIVKKNAIMMIDFALEAERTRGRAPRRRSTRPASSGSGRSS